MPSPFPELLRIEPHAILGVKNILEGGDSLTTLPPRSKWSLPVLKAQPAGFQAAGIAYLDVLEELSAEIAAFYPGGAAVCASWGDMGYDGQRVPLHGSVVLDRLRLNRLLSLADGVLRTDPVLRRATLGTAAHTAGRELRCMLSKSMNATVGGFTCGVEMEPTAIKPESSS